MTVKSEAACPLHGPRIDSLVLARTDPRAGHVQRSCGRGTDLESLARYQPSPSSITPRIAPGKASVGTRKARIGARKARIRAGKSRVRAWSHASVDREPRVTATGRRVRRAA